MRHQCVYTPTMMSGPVVRFEFGYDLGRLKPFFGGEERTDYSGEISASRNGVSISGQFPIWTDRASIDVIKQLMDWAWSAHVAIGDRGDHDAAKRWVELHNASLAALREMASK